jgi:hypothetical protein
VEVDGQAGGGDRGALVAEQGELAVEQMGRWRAVGPQDPPPGDALLLAVADQDLADVAGGGVGLGQGGHVAVGQDPARGDPPDHGQHLGRQVVH